MRLFSHKKRAVHQGSFPLETLPRLADPAASPIGLRGAVPASPSEPHRQGPLAAAHALGVYVDLFDAHVSGDVSPPAPIPTDPAEREIT